ncbi:uncharacterized protein VNE69_05178 [Vairimorpha necatrix]|uniref:Membrane protein n=1 Tax=Vairimorpha necatrix TaxID=6039 RepID=A0AAX4JC60_9MICR
MNNLSILSLGILILSTFLVLGTFLILYIYFSLKRKNERITEKSSKNLNFDKSLRLLKAKGKDFTKEQWENILIALEIYTEEITSWLHVGFSDFPIKRGFVDEYFSDLKISVNQLINGLTGFDNEILYRNSCVQLIIDAIIPIKDIEGYKVLFEEYSKEPYISKRIEAEESCSEDIKERLYNYKIKYMHEGEEKYILLGDYVSGSLFERIKLLREV